MIMSNLTEDEKIKAFVQALTLALQAIASKPPESAGAKRKPRRHKKADQDKTKHLDFGLLVEGVEKRKPSELKCRLRDHTGSGGFRD
jgi:hypothetical protein